MNEAIEKHNELNQKLFDGNRLKPEVREKAEEIINEFLKILAEDEIFIRGVYERSDVKVRRQEGMELTKGFLGEEFPTLVEIEENGVKYQVDIKDGQKTGFFLDQKYNRLAIQKLPIKCKMVFRETEKEGE